VAWDIELEAETSDLVFSPARDIAGVSGEQILRQRISIRCKIPRATYMYDVDGNLGSTLHLVPRISTPAQLEAAQGAVMEALEPMSDEINIISVDTVKTEDNTLQVSVNFEPVRTDPDVPTIDDTLLSEVDAISVTIKPD
jgi:hypothetical protein